MAQPTQPLAFPYYSAAVLKTALKTIPSCGAPVYSMGGTAQGAAQGISYGAAHIHDRTCDVVVVASRRLPFLSVQGFSEESRSRSSVTAEFLSRVSVERHQSNDYITEPEQSVLSPSSLSLNVQILTRTLPNRTSTDLQYHYAHPFSNSIDFSPHRTRQLGSRSSCPVTPNFDQARFRCHHRLQLALSGCRSPRRWRASQHQGVRPLQSQQQPSVLQPMGHRAGRQQRSQVERSPDWKW